MESTARDPRDRAFSGVRPGQIELSERGRDTGREERKGKGKGKEGRGRRSKVNSQPDRTFRAGDGYRTGRRKGEQGKGKGKEGGKER